MRPPVLLLLRLLAAAGAVAEAVAHIPVTAMHLEEAPWAGVGFVLLTVAGFLLAMVLVQADEPVAWLLTAVVAAAALAGYVLSRTVGLPQLHDDIGMWDDPLGTLAITAEALMLVCALARLVLGRPASRLSAPITVAEEAEALLERPGAGG